MSLSPVPRGENLLVRCGGSAPVRLADPQHLDLRFIIPLWNAEMCIGSLPLLEQRRQLSQYQWYPCRALGAAAARSLGFSVE